MKLTSQDQAIFAPCVDLLKTSPFQINNENWHGRENPVFCSLSVMNCIIPFLLVAGKETEHRPYSRKQMYNIYDAMLTTRNTLWIHKNS